MLWIPKIHDFGLWRPQMRHESQGHFQNICEIFIWRPLEGLGVCTWSEFVQEDRSRLSGAYDTEEVKEIKVPMRADCVVFMISFSSWGKCLQI